MEIFRPTVHIPGISKRTMFFTCFHCSYHPRHINSGQTLGVHHHSLIPNDFYIRRVVTSNDSSPGYSHRTWGYRHSPCELYSTNPILFEPTIFFFVTVNPGPLLTPVGQTRIRWGPWFPTRKWKRVMVQEERSGVQTDVGCHSLQEIHAKNARAAAL